MDVRPRGGRRTGNPTLRVPVRVDATCNDRTIKDVDLMECAGRNESADRAHPSAWERSEGWGGWERERCPAQTTGRVPGLSKRIRSHSRRTWLRPYATSSKPSLSR